MQRSQRSEWLSTEQLKRGRRSTPVIPPARKRSVKVAPTLCAVVFLIIVSEAIIRWAGG